MDKEEFGYKTLRPEHLDMSCTEDKVKIKVANSRDDRERFMSNDLNSNNVNEKSLENRFNQKFKRY